VYPEAARAAADQADERRARGERPPLLGVPIAVTDEMDPAGEVTGRGTRARRAAGMVPAAIGVDGAGSIRIPAACCGVFGLKPQSGRVPRDPNFPDAGHWICFGALTRSVRDTAIVLDVIADRPPGTPPYAEAARTPPPRLRIGLSAAFPTGTRGRLSREVAAALQETAELLRSLGHTVDPADINLRVRDVPVMMGLLFRGIRDLVDDAEQPQRLERRTRAIARPGVLIGDRLLARLERAEARIAERLRREFAHYDLLLTPVMARPAVRAGIMEGRGATVTYLWETGWVPFNVLWNSTGQPAASVPAGLSADGLPLAVQLIARPDDERTLLAVAAQLEQARPWAGKRPPLGA
jgi:amidase